MAEGSPKIGDRIQCALCGAAYEAVEGLSILSKDDARCRFCQFVLITWPQSFALRIIKFPDRKLSQG